MKLGFSSFSHPGSIEPFNQIYFSSKPIANAKDLDGCDALLLWGGTDINPQYYNQESHPQTFFYADSLRDIREWEMMHEAARLNIPIIGVCRGAQFMCAFSGGRLVQDVGGHVFGAHPVTVRTKEGTCAEMFTSSAHHQMLYLGDLEVGKDYQLLAWSTEPLSHHYDGVSPNEQLFQAREPEAVHFPKIRGFAVQGHPEWMDPQSDYVQWCLEQIKSL